MASEKIYPTGPIDKYVKLTSGLQQFRKKKKDRFQELTKREVEVLKLVAEGMSNPEIAEELDISRTTVQNYRAAIRDKLNISHQTDFIKFAMAFELIQF